VVTGNSGESGYAQDGELSREQAEQAVWLTKTGRTFTGIWVDPVPADDIGLWQINGRLTEWSGEVV
jgi:hypothetical protein